MSRLILLALVLSCFGLAACASGDSTHRGTTADYAAEFEGLSIRRIGDDRPGNREFQNRAISRALSDLAAKGVSHDDIENITVSTSGGSLSGGSSFLSLGRSYTYDLWFTIKGCDSSVVYRAGPTGAITTMADKSNCLSGG
jgi:hypothetical protein